MKQVTNWSKATVFDVETNGFLEVATKVHVISYELWSGGSKSIPGTDPERIKKLFQHHIDNGIPMVAHNGICFDLPVLEKLVGMDLSDLMLIDTLPLSWYLNTKRRVHGLDSFYEDYGVAKPPVADWDGEPYEVYEYRCEQDVKINSPLYWDLIGRLEGLYTTVKEAVDQGLVDGTRMSPDEECYIDQYKWTSSVSDYVDRILTFLMFKMDNVRLKEKTKWQLDVDGAHVLQTKLATLIGEAKEGLESVMPKIPKYSLRTRPKKPTKIDGTLSVSGQKWNDLIKQHNSEEVDEFGTRLAEGVDSNTIRVLSKYAPPNANSHGQIKDFLYSYGWEPSVYKDVVDKEEKELWVDSGFKKELKPVPRKVPQVSIDGPNGKELCESVVKLAEEVPEIMHYQKYTMINTRHSTVSGFLRDIDESGRIAASTGGFTNCMTADALILTDSGHIPIVDVCKGDRVLTHEGTYSVVTDWIDNGIKKVMRITLSTGQEIKCTPNHRVMTGKGWVYARDLEEGILVSTYGDVEKWEDIGGFEGCKISSWGRVMGPKGNIYKSKRRDAQDIRCNVTLPIRGSRGKTFVVSRLVMEAFVGRSDLHVLHKDGNPNNNNIQNLYYGTDADNWEDTKKHGTHLWATRNRVNLKLSEAAAKEVRSRYSKGGITQKQLAQEYGVSSGLISNIIANKRWSDSQQATNKYLEDFDSSEIVEIVRLGEVPTFDISVDKSHSYIANGVVVHNTLREQHRTIVNLPGVKAAYGKDIRGLLIAGEGNICLGSDLSSLEDRVKHHFMLAHDPEYVEEMMADNYDPHITMALTASMITQQEFDNFMVGTKSANALEARRKGKTTNYTSVYNGGAATIAKAAGVPLKEGKRLHGAYWKLNWSVKKIAEELHVFEHVHTIERTGVKETYNWLINPINGFCYSLRKESDRFSTLCQGTGSFLFDMWIDNILNMMVESFNTKRLSLLMHDEYAAVFKDTPKNRGDMEEITYKAIDNINKTYKLRRNMGCDVQFGSSYADIH